MTKGLNGGKKCLEAKDNFSAAIIGIATLFDNPGEAARLIREKIRPIETNEEDKWYRTQRKLGELLTELYEAERELHERRRKHRQKSNLSLLEFRLDEWIEGLKKFERQEEIRAGQRYVEKEMLKGAEVEVKEAKEGVAEAVEKMLEAIEGENGADGIHENVAGVLSDEKIHAAFMKREDLALKAKTS